MSSIELKVPDIGGSSKVPVIEILVKVGDSVTKDQGLVTLESDKATMEVPASTGGIIKELRVKLGDELSEGDVIAIVESADSVVEKVGFYLGQATANIANILNPDSVVIGGGVSAAGEFLRSRVEKYFVTYAFPQVRKTTKVKIAELGNDAGIIGAASLASQFVD